MLLDLKKIIFLTLIWLLTSQSVLMASVDMSFETNNSHCDQQQLVDHHDCCQDLLTGSHCNTCSQINLTSTATLIFVFDDRKTGSTTIFKKAFYSAPVLELFKPPI